MLERERRPSSDSLIVQMSSPALGSASERSPLVQKKRSTGGGGRVSQQLEPYGISPEPPSSVAIDITAPQRLVSGGVFESLEVDDNDDTHPICRFFTISLPVFLCCTCIGATFWGLNFGAAALDNCAHNITAIDVPGSKVSGFTEKEQHECIFAAVIVFVLEGILLSLVCVCICAYTLCRIHIARPHVVSSIVIVESRVFYIIVLDSVLII